jgi:serine O-acetyltransferase
MECPKKHPRYFSGTFSLIKEDFKAHGSDCSRSGFRALAIHRFGEWAQNRPGKLSNFFFRNIYWFLHRYFRNHSCIEIMNGARIGRQVVFAHQGGTVIHCNAKIGDHCFIRHNVTLGARSQNDSNVAPTLKNNVEVGVGAVIFGGITIGEHAVIGANAVVGTNVPARALVKAPSPEIIIKMPPKQQQTKCCLPSIQPVLTREGNYVNIGITH